MKQKTKKQHTSPYTPDPPFTAVTKSLPATLGFALLAIVMGILFILLQAEHQQLAFPGIAPGSAGDTFEDFADLHKPCIVEHKRAYPVQYQIRARGGRGCSTGEGGSHHGINIVKRGGQMGLISGQEIIAGIVTVQIQQVQVFHQLFSGGGGGMMIVQKHIKPLLSPALGSTHFQKIHRIYVTKSCYDF